MVDKISSKNYNKSMTDKHKRADESKEEAAKENTQKSEKIYFSHNNFFAAFFDEKEVVESFLKEFVPAEITKDLDFNTLQIDKESFVDKKLLRHFSDILYLIRYKQNPAYVYFLFEHKSRVKKKKKKLTPFQLLKYMINIWDRHLKQHKGVENLPPIIPMVIYHGEEKWEVKTDFISLFDVPQCMEKYIPNFGFELYDISHKPDEYIKGTILLRVLFLTFKYISNPELLHKLKDIFRLLMELEDKTRGTEYLEILLRYLSSSAQHVSVEELRETVGEFFEQGGDIMPTIVQQAKNEGREERDIEIAKKMIAKGMDVDTIVDITGISRKKLEKIASTTHKTYRTHIN
jgi:predicted transposase/invertase (TIGR01784 family)